MDKSCPVVRSGNSKRILECFLLYMCGVRGCVCVRHALIYAPSVRYVDIADRVIILAVPHNSCGRSSSETNVLDGNQNL